MSSRALRVSLIAVAPLACPLLYAGAASAADLPAQSAIDNVLVFPYGADVTRLGEISIPEGEHRVIVSGLPLYLNPDSLRAAFGSEAIIVGAVEAADAFPEGGGPEEARRLRDELQDLQDQMQAIDDRIATAQMQVQFLARQAQAPEAGGAEALDPEDWATALAAIESGGLAARRTILEARQQRRALEQAAAEIQLQLDSWDDDLAMRTNVEIALTATQAVTTPFSLEYQVEEAGWSALYEARLDSETASMALERKIKVYQDTGEDWAGVRLAVSTAPPVAQLAAPTVYPPHLMLQPPAPPPPPPAPAGRSEAARERAAGLFDMAEEDQVVVTGSRFAPIDRVDASFASTYTVGGRVDVASDNEPRTFTIGQEEVALELVIRTAPRTSLDAFVTAKVTYEGDGPLPGGALRKYRDGAYLREDWLPTMVPGEEIELGFGIDQSVVVTWVDESGPTAETGLMGRNTEVRHDHRFSALNRHNTPFTVEIVDYRPISEDDDITLRVSPEATPPDEEGFADTPGVLVWRRELAPEESLEVRNAYAITHPTNEILVSR